MTQKKRSSTPPKKRRRSSRNSKQSAVTWAERSFGHGYKRVFWIGIIIAAGVYLFVTYNYIVAPTSNLWQGLFGTTKYPEEYAVRGIDISRYQSEIDWEKVAAAKIDRQPIRFVIAKATEGKEHVDKNFNDNFYQIGQYDFIRGAYHFFSPLVSGDVQAKHYLKQVHLEPGDLAPVLDVESIGTLSAEQLRKEVAEWLNIVEKHYNTTPIIYTGLKFKEKYLNTPTFDRYHFWIAHYYVKQLSYKGKWKFWQFTDRGKIDGISGDVDLNVYNGSSYDLQQLTIGEQEPEDTEAQ
jgi:family 25 glycosyl hydrolase